VKESPTSKNAVSHRVMMTLVE